MVLSKTINAICALFHNKNSSLVNICVIIAQSQAISNTFYWTVYKKQTTAAFSGDLLV